MMKLLSGEWIAAENENKTIRDAARAQFWADVGVTPAKEAAEVSLAPAQRLGTIAGLVQTAVSGPEGDAELRRITAIAGGAVAQLGLGGFAHAATNLSPSIANMAPRALRSFFTGDERTAFELSLTGGEG